MARFELGTSGSAVPLDELGLDAWEQADVVLVDGGGLCVAMDDGSVATIAATAAGVFRVTAGMVYREGNLQATDSGGAVQASLRIRVGPIHAAFRSQGTSEYVEIRDATEITLDRGQGLAVSANASIVTVQETTPATAKGRRTFHVARVDGAEGKTDLVAASGGHTYASIRILATDQILRSAIAPGGPNSTTQRLEDVPDELIDAADEGTVPCENRAAVWLDVQARFAFQYFLHAYHHTWKRNLDPRAALILVAQAGIETSYAKPGVSPNTPENNFLSFQPLPEPEAQLKSYGIPVPLEPRGNNKSSPPTPSPHFKDIDQSLEMMFAVAFEFHIYTPMRDILRSPRPSAVSYAAAGDAAKWGQEYSKDPAAPDRANLPDAYDTSTKFIKRMLNGLPTNFRTETRQWAARLALQL